MEDPSNQDTAPKEVTTTPKESDGVVSNTPIPIISDEVKETMKKDINNMLSFAVFNGTIVNTEVITLIKDGSVDNLVNAHNLLARNVAPATPKSIEYTRKIHEDDRNKSLFSKHPLVRNLIILAFVFLAGFIGTSLSKGVNNNSLDSGLFDNQGANLLLNITFLISVSGLGVVFYLLKNVNTAIQNGTLVPEDKIYYLALIVLGVISGLIMSEIISFYRIGESGTTTDGINLFNKSLLALIGGFSSDAIFSVLQGIIGRVKAIFSVSN